MKRSDELAKLELAMEAARVEHEGRCEQLKHPLVREMQKRAHWEEMGRMQRKWLKLSGEASVSG